jgi:hypothetical protein
LITAPSFGYKNYHFFITIEKDFTFLISITNYLSYLFIQGLLNKLTKDDLKGDTHPGHQLYYLKRSF